MPDDSRSPFNIRAAHALARLQGNLNGFSSLTATLKGLKLPFEALRRDIDTALDSVRAAYRNPEFVAVWQLFKELEKRDPDAYAALGELTPRQLYQMRKVLRLPPRPIGRPAGKRQQVIETALAAMAAGKAVPGPRHRRKYVRKLHRGSIRGE